jgi:hypothetical protein
VLVGILPAMTTTNTLTCPCGEPVEHWETANSDQWHGTFPPRGRLGEEVAVFYDHAHGLRHLVSDGQVLGSTQHARSRE